MLVSIHIDKKERPSVQHIKQGADAIRRGRVQVRADDIPVQEQAENGNDITQGVNVTRQVQELSH